jgi:hypothetical protein
VHDGKVESVERVSSVVTADVAYMVENENATVVPGDPSSAERPPFG